MSNGGKRFEKNFEDSVKEYKKKHLQTSKDISYIRLYDPGHGFGGVSNICDYIVYSTPNIMFLELKSTKSNRLNLSNAITDTQYEGLKEQSSIKGTIPGFLIKFDSFDEAYFIHIDLLNRVQEQISRGKNKGDMRWSYQIDGEKSITPEKAEDIGIVLMGRKKQVNWDYDIGCLLRALKCRYGEGL